MAIFEIKVQELLEKVVEVEADSLMEALASVTRDYHAGEIKLTREHAKQVMLSQFAHNQNWSEENEVTLL